MGQNAKLDREVGTVALHQTAALVRHRPPVLADFDFLHADEVQPDVCGAVFEERGRGGYVMQQVGIRIALLSLRELFRVERQQVDLRNPGHRLRILPGRARKPFVHVAHAVPISVGQDVHVPPFPVALPIDRPQRQRLVVRPSGPAVRPPSGLFEQLDLDRFAWFRLCISNAPCVPAQTPGWQPPEDRTALASPPVLRQRELAAVNGPEAANATAYRQDAGIVRLSSHPLGAARAVEHDVAPVSGPRDGRPNQGRDSQAQTHQRPAPGRSVIGGHSHRPAAPAADSPAR